MVRLGARLASVFLLVFAASRIVVAERVIVSVKDEMTSGDGSKADEAPADPETSGDGAEDAATRTDDPQSRVNSFITEFGYGPNDGKREAALAKEKQREQDRIAEETEGARIRGEKREESNQEADDKRNEVKKVADDQFAVEKEKRDESEKVASEADTAAEKQHATEKTKRKNDQEAAEAAMTAASEEAEAQKTILDKLADDEKKIDAAESARLEKARIARETRLEESDIAQKAEEARIAEEGRYKANKEADEKREEANEAAHDKFAELLPGTWATTEANSVYSDRWYRIAKTHAGSKFPLSIAVMKTERSGESPFVAGDIVKYTGGLFENGDYGFVIDDMTEVKTTTTNKALTTAEHLKVKWTLEGGKSLEEPVPITDVVLIEFSRVKAKAIGELTAQDCLQDGCCKKSLHYNRKGGLWKAGLWKALTKSEEVEEEKVDLNVKICLDDAVGQGDVSEKLKIVEERKKAGKPSETKKRAQMTHVKTLTSFTKVDFPQK